MSYNSQQDRREKCPYCGYAGCQADWVNVGVGFVQCGPFVCNECHASEIGPYDETPCTEEEKKVGWYRGGTIGSSANSFNGKHIDHITAKTLYRAGLTINDHRD